jgi:hypothetical protein
MDTDVWKVLAAAANAVARSIPPLNANTQYSDALILKMYLWAALHERPLCWACQRAHYTSRFRPRRLPSVSQFCRRVQAARFATLLGRLHTRLTRRNAEQPGVLIVDGKPLLVSRCSRDPDARCGWAINGFGVGYRLHALTSHDGRILAFQVQPLNVGEAKVAREELVPLAPPQCVALADANYDSRHLYNAFGHGRVQLFTPLKRIAVRPAAQRKMGPFRRLAAALSQQAPAAYRKLLDLRGGVERIFSALTCCAGGLHSLPAWVRRLSRVRRWVAAKIAIYHARLQLRLEHARQ